MDNAQVNVDAARYSVNMAWRNQKEIVTEVRHCANMPRYNTLLLAVRSITSHTYCVNRVRCSTNKPNKYVNTAYNASTQLALQRTSQIRTT